MKENRRNSSCETKMYRPHTRFYLVSESEGERDVLNSMNKGKPGLLSAGRRDKGRAASQAPHCWRTLAGTFMLNVL